MINTEDTNSETDDDTFYFESDHLALRGNSDYSAVLRTIAILQAQRIQATKDIDKIAEAEKRALNEPEVFLEKIIKGESLGLPGPINVIEIPKINLNKYDISVPEFPKDTTDNEAKVNDITVRGRVFDQTKPVTFNQLWTSEEQRRLEELLIEFPPQVVEMRRFAKIAHALGNRTTKQVASRCQKFFKKLYSAGMPIPGRLPKNNRILSKSIRFRTQKNFLRPSTFFPSEQVPVQIPEDDDCGDGVPIDLHFNQKDENTQSVCVDEDSNSSDAYTNLTNDEKILKLILRVKNDKDKYQMINPNLSEHFGFKCDYCNEEPIVGTRWKCVTCSQSSIDFCSDCLITQLNDPTIRHPLSHKIVGYRIGTEDQIISRLPSDVDSQSDDDSYEKGSAEDQSSIYDKDYMAQKFCKEEEYNYLDPNFLPQ